MTHKDPEGRYFAEVFDAEGVYYVFDRDDGGNEVEGVGPFDNYPDALRAVEQLEADDQAGHSDPRPDPVTNPEYWSE